MYKSDIKETVGGVMFLIINAIISFVITGLLGISNIVIYHSLTALPGDITYEVIIFMALSLIGASIYELVIEKQKSYGRY